MNLLLAYQKEHTTDVNPVASSQKSLLRFMSKTLPILPMTSHVVPVCVDYHLNFDHADIDIYIEPANAYVRTNLYIPCTLAFQVSESKDYEDDPDDGKSKASHVKVHIVDIKSVIQRMYLHPNTPWYKARPEDGYRTFANVPFAQV